MSRLCGFLRRLRAQRDCLNLAIASISVLEGSVLELGWGRGRTLSHLLEHLPHKDIHVIEKEISAPEHPLQPRVILLLGDARTLLPQLALSARGTFCLIHNDLCGYDESEGSELSRQLSPHIAALLSPKGICVSAVPLERPLLMTLPPPPSVRVGKYYMYCRP